MNMQSQLQLQLQLHQRSIHLSNFYANTKSKPKNLEYHLAYIKFYKFPVWYFVTGTTWAASGFRSVWEMYAKMEDICISSATKSMIFIRPLRLYANHLQDV